MSNIENTVFLFIKYRKQWFNRRTADQASWKLRRASCGARESWGARIFRHWSGQREQTQGGHRRGSPRFSHCFSRIRPALSERRWRICWAECWNRSTLWQCRETRWSPAERRASRGIVLLRKGLLRSRVLRWW